MFPRLPLLLLLLPLLACSGNGGQVQDGAADLPPPDTPLVRLDQQPLPFEAGLPDQGLPDAPPVTTLTAPFFLDFEQDDGRLVGTRDWEWGQIDFQPSTGPNAPCDNASYTPPTAGHSGTGMWGTKLNDCYSPLDNAKSPCSNENLIDDSVLAFKVKIPATLPNPRLTYWEWSDYFLDFDWTEVRVDNDVVQQVCSGSLTTPPTWEKRSIDLKSYTGATVEITFHFMASSVINYSGWYIDDLAVNSD